MHQMMVECPKFMVDQIRTCFLVVARVAKLHKFIPLTGVKQ